MRYRCNYIFIYGFIVVVITSDIIFTIIIIIFTIINIITKNIISYNELLRPVLRLRVTLQCDLVN